jgi:hypothetical protein
MKKEARRPKKSPAAATAAREEQKTGKFPDAQPQMTPTTRGTSKQHGLSFLKIFDSAATE